MRKFTLAVTALVALVAASIAVAHGGEGSKTAKAVAGTFSAAAGTVNSRSCTTTDGKTIVVTSGTYTGTATGDADLTGAVTIRARSVINTTDNVGTVEGDLRVGDHTHAAFSGVYSGGSVAGLAFGRAPSGGLLGNVSATFSATTGFTNGKVGGGTAGGAAVEIAPGGCNASGSNSEKSHAEGTVSALSASSITVAGLTCAIPPAMSADVNAKVKQGDAVEIECALANGVSTLTKVEKRH